MKVYRVTEILSSCKKYRIDLRKTVKVSGTRCYVERPHYTFAALALSSFILKSVCPKCNCSKTIYSSILTASK
jgi:seryl-tRNA synthetase